MDCKFMLDFIRRLAKEGSITIDMEKNYPVPYPYEDELNYLKEHEYIFAMA